MNAGSAFAPLLGLALIGLATTADVAEGAKAPPKRVVVTGVIKFEIELTAGPAIPDATVVTLNFSASGFDAAFVNGSYAYASAKVAKGRVSKKISVPFTWGVVDRKAKINVSVNAYANGDGVNDSSSFNYEVALPEDGAVRTVKVAGTI